MWSSADCLPRQAGGELTLIKIGATIGGTANVSKMHQLCLSFCPSLPPCRPMTYRIWPLLAFSARSMKRWPLLAGHGLEIEQLGSIDLVSTTSLEQVNGTNDARIRCQGNIAYAPLISVNISVGRGMHAARWKQHRAPCVWVRVSLSRCGGAVATWPSPRFLACTERSTATESWPSSTRGDICVQLEWKL